MRSRMIQGFALAGMLSFVSGCVFTQWTDHAFLGSPDDPPTHQNREWVGAVVLPLAVAGDILTAPGQIIALLILGDGGMYARPNGRVAVVMEIPSAPGGKDAALAFLDSKQGAELAGATPAKGLRVWGVGADHRATEIPLSAAQQVELAGRIESSSPTTVLHAGA